MVGVRWRYTDERGRWGKTEAEKEEVGRGRGKGREEDGGRDKMAFWNVVGARMRAFERVALDTVHLDIVQLDIVQSDTVL